MVTTRDSGSKAAGFRDRFKSYLVNFGTKVTLRRETQVKDSMGRMTETTTNTTSNVKADIQWVTKADLQHLNVGEVEIGDGMLFVQYSADVELEDEFDYNDKRWRITTQIEGEQVTGDVVYLGYIFKKNA